MRGDAGVGKGERGIGFDVLGLAPGLAFIVRDHGGERGACAAVVGAEHGFLRVLPFDDGIQHHEPIAGAGDACDGGGRFGGFDVPLLGLLQVSPPSLE